jgi:hypothetical protein
MPTGEDDVVLGGCDVGREAVERGRTVDQRLEPVARARGRVARTPERPGRRRVRTLPAVPPQAAPVMGDDESLDSGPDCVVQAIDPRHRHASARVSAHAPARAR